MATEGNLVTTVTGVIVAICVSVGGVYTIALVPLEKRIEKLENARDHDREQLAALYSLKSELESLRRDVVRVEGFSIKIADEQQRRTTSVTSVASLEKRIDELGRKLDDIEHRFSGTYTVSDELKSLRGELQDLRRRIMVPLISNSKGD